MAVEAARAALSDAAPPLDAVCFASTTAPFLDRQNAGVVAAALDLPTATHTYDMSGSQRAATSALISLMHQGQGRRTLLAAADARPTRTGSVLEMLSGDAAAAIVVGSGAIIAEIVYVASVHADLVDHYRTTTSGTDYVLEERWYRDEGVVKLTPIVAQRVLDDAGIASHDIRHFISALPNPALNAAAAKAVGVREDALADSLFFKCGHAGAAQPILLLADVMERAKPGEWILLTGLGQGCDALLLRATEAIAERRHAGVRDVIDGGRLETNYVRFLSDKGALEIDWGMRAERDSRTAQTVAFNKSRDIYGFVGGICQFCATPQFPKSRRCVNPDCAALDSQRDYRFADRSATVKSYTEDWMAFTRRPPLIYGNVSFEGGGNVFMEMCEFTSGEVGVGTPVSMKFRIKDIDEARGFHRYFWKAGPANAPGRNVGAHG